MTGVRRVRRLGLRGHRRHPQDAQDRSHSEEAAALGVTKGCDLECGSVTSLKTAVAGLIAERDIDVAVKRLMLARLRPYIRPAGEGALRRSYSVSQSAEHDRLARRMAQESVVLLKNDRLALARDKKVAVIGPNADEVMTPRQHYGTPAKPVTVLADPRAIARPSSTRAEPTSSRDGRIHGPFKPSTRRTWPWTAARACAANTSAGASSEGRRC